MEQPEAQSDSQTPHFDPDALDLSEQKFAASLEAESTKPSFMLDDPEANHTDSTTDPERTQLPRPSEEIVESLHSEGRDTPSPPMNEDWRDQVSAKVNRYKSRKAPKVRYPSLQLQFETPAPRVRSSLELESGFSIEMAAPAEIPQSRQVSENFVSLEATARVIEFPRPSAPLPRTDELAEPLLDRPRIVEAPALVPPPPALGGILIEETREQAPERRPGIDMPLQSAPLGRRALAAGVDGLFVAVGLALFGYVFLRFNGPVQQTKLALQLTADLLIGLWSAYQYAFLVYTGSTPGLRICKLALTGFDGRSVSRRRRRWRVLTSFLSCVSLGLGYAWCFFDEDQLSWHDRITKTHLALLNSRSQS